MWSHSYLDFRWDHRVLTCLPCCCLHLPCTFLKTPTQSRPDIQMTLPLNTVQGHSGLTTFHGTLFPYSTFSNSLGYYLRMENPNDQWHRINRRVSFVLKCTMKLVQASFSLLPVPASQSTTWSTYLKTCTASAQTGWVVWSNLLLQTPSISTGVTQKFQAGGVST